MDFTDNVAALLLRSLGNGAGVDEVDIGLVLPVHDFEPVGDEASFVCRSLSVVQLAT